MPSYKEFLNMPEAQLQHMKRAELAPIVQRLARIANAHYKRLNDNLGDNAQLFPLYKLYDRVPSTGKGTRGLNVGQLRRQYSDLNRALQYQTFNLKDAKAQLKHWEKQVENRLPPGQKMNERISDIYKLADRMKESGHYAGDFWWVGKSSDRIILRAFKLAEEYEDLEKINLEEDAKKGEDNPDEWLTVSEDGDLPF